MKKNRNSIAEFSRKVLVLKHVRSSWCELHLVVCFSHVEYGGGDCISVPWLITKARDFLLALSGNTHLGAGQCHVMKIPKHPDGEARVWGMEAMWGIILEVGPPAPVAPSGEGAPGNTLTAASAETLSHTPSHSKFLTHQHWDGKHWFI